MGRKAKRPPVIKTVESLHKATMDYLLAKEGNRHPGRTDNRTINSKFITMEEQIKDATAVLAKAKKTLQDERELEETINWAKSFIQKVQKNTNSNPPPARAHQPAETTHIDNSSPSPVESSKPTSTAADFHYTQEAAAIAREEEAIAIAEARASLQRQEEEKKAPPG